MSTTETFQGDIQKFNPGKLISLYELDATDLGGSVLRFTPMTDNGSAVIFDGNTYSPLNIEVSGFEITGRGTLPQPTVRVSNVSSIVSAAVLSYNDLIGSIFKRIRTYEQYLDNGSRPDPTQKFPDDVFIVDQKIQHNKVYIEFKLVSAIDHENFQIPRRQIIRDYCDHIYRRWTGSAFSYTKATCPYTDAAMFTKRGITTTDPEEDLCGKRLSDCKLRFGAEAELPTRAFPGVSRVLP